MLARLVRTSAKFSEPSIVIAHIVKRNAGHSKWANIRHTKGAKDAQRSLLFTRLSRMMKVAIQEGGSADPKSNLRLEHIMEQARRANMPTATIQSIIKSSQANKSASKTYQVEIKGPGSCIILVDVFTENLSAVKQNIASIMKKHSSRFLDGGAKHCFEEKGIIQAPKPENCTDEELLEKATDHAIECGAEDVKLMDDVIEFSCSASSLKKVTIELEKLYTLSSASVEYIPIRGQELSEQEMVECSKLLEKLETLPEVVRTYDNIV